MMEPVISDKLVQNGESSNGSPLPLPHTGHSGSSSVSYCQLIATDIKDMDAVHDTVAVGDITYYIYVFFFQLFRQREMFI